MIDNEIKNNLIRHGSKYECVKCKKYLDDDKLIAVSKELHYGGQGSSFEQLYKCCELYYIVENGN